MLMSKMEFCKTFCKTLEVYVLPDGMLKPIVPARKPSIAILGPGALGTALAVALHAAGYRISAILARPSSMHRARALARRVSSVAKTTEEASLDAGLVWLCVPDDAIPNCARHLAKTGTWTKRVVLHSSGALGGDVLSPLRERGASVASLHPMMTFAVGVRRSFAGISFAVEGDAAAVRRSRSLVRDLGGSVFSIRPEDKALYHMCGFFAAPLLLTTLATAERVAVAAGIPQRSARAFLKPIVKQTVENYLEHGAAASLTGPLARGDVDTIRKHLQALRRVPEAREAYLALARTAIQMLPIRNRAELKRLLRY
jgi:predicted short-subunit dehydrogenase-like oxidoreductase (DUF2520 family)